ncbi:hypothetical protein [Hymenobacter sp. BT559]|uniref:hypothetical protein n=1 Tax=Hymenobacter sp. BT559 TaxID=2795729 RepID=UPI0018ED9C10|nr:hypothetical protein [Hymenobacter sp. BT559]
MIAFRFYRRNDIVLYTPACVYEGDLVEPARWAHLSAGTRVFVRLWGGLETAPIVGGLILDNKLSKYELIPDSYALNDSGCLLSLDLNPDRPTGQEPAAGEVVHWHRSQFQTLFVYWERAVKAGPKRDAPC